MQYCAPRVLPSVHYSSSTRKALSATSTYIRSAINRRIQSCSKNSRKFRGNVEFSRSCIPYTPLKRDLKECRIALVSTSGAYVEGMQPFTDNDLSFRLIPADTDTKKIKFVPGH